MTPLIARQPALANARLLSVAAALAMAVVSFVVSGDPAAAGVSVHGGR